MGAFWVVGKGTAGAAFVLVWLVTSEIYPTNLRSQALGTFSTLAKIFGLLCPFVSSLASVWSPLPMLVLGVPTMLAGLASALLLPETKKEDLPQSMREAREIRNVTKK